MELEAIFLSVYNVGTKFSNEELKDLLKNPEDFSKYEYIRPTPEEIPTFDMPSIFNLKDEGIAVDGKQCKLKVQASIYSTGSFSIRLRLKDTLTEQQLRKIAFDKDVKEKLASVAGRARAKVEHSLAKIKHIMPTSAVEGYAFYYLNEDKAKMLSQYKKLIAGLLVDEPNVEALDEHYIEEVLRKSITYNTGDALYVGWESALMIDNTGSFEHELIVSEIANVQLLEMQIYNKMLAKSIEETEGIIRNVLSSEPFGGRAIKAASLKLSSTYDVITEMSNAARSTISGFGEWYLSRLYALFYDVFRLGSWQAMLDDGLEVIDKRREFVIETMRSHRMDVLEIIVILLIVVEIVIEVAFILAVK